MGEIDFTNIVIDDFRKGKWNPQNKYIYILTHIHSDHLRGLSNSWSYGPIYCSQITSRLIINKYPNLHAFIRVLTLEEPYTIELGQDLHATVTFYDANHCRGAVIVLLEGYFGRFVYTGDFRFNKQTFKRYTGLYPPELCTPRFQKCSKPVDKLWLDNTFCNPKFDFPTQQDAFQLLSEFVGQNLGKRIYVGMDYYGKQEALIFIAQKFQTLIVVDEYRYETIIAMELDREDFTTNPQEGLIEVVQKPKLRARMQDDPDSLGLIMSGWCNTPYFSQDGRTYHIPYSLHSNYPQLVAFVNSIRPSIIEPIVPLDESSPHAQTTNHSSSKFSKYGNAEAFRQLVKVYTSPISELYLANQSDTNFLEVLKVKLGLDKQSSTHEKVRAEASNFAVPAKGKGYKIENERNQQEIEKVKRQLEKKRMSIQHRKVKEITIQADNSSEIQEIKEPNRVDKSGNSGSRQNQGQQNEGQNQTLAVDEEKGESLKKSEDGRSESLKQERMGDINMRIDMNSLNKYKFLGSKQELMDYYYQKMRTKLFEISHPPQTSSST